MNKDETPQQVAVVRPRTRMSFAGLSQSQREQLQPHLQPHVPPRHQQTSDDGQATTTRVDSRQRLHVSEYNLQHKSVRMLSKPLRATACCHMQSS